MNWSVITEKRAEKGAIKVTQRAGMLMIAANGHSIELTSAQAGYLLEMLHDLYGPQQAEGA